jgi:hypothetical protein
LLIAGARMSFITRQFSLSEIIAQLLVYSVISQNGFRRDHPAHRYAFGGSSMGRPEVTGRKLSTAADEVDAFSIADFCKRHGISAQLFYKFKADMPATFRIGTRVLVSKEAAARWRAEREAASADASA